MKTGKVVCDLCLKEVLFEDDNPFKHVGVTIHQGYTSDNNINDYDLCLDCFNKTIGKFKNGRRRMTLSNWLKEDDDKPMLKPRKEYLEEKRKEAKEKPKEGLF